MTGSNQGFNQVRGIGNDDWSEQNIVQNKV